MMERLQAVDFSTPVLSSALVGIIPFKREKVTEVIIRPFDWKIWVCLACLIATFMLALAISDLIFNGHIKWWNLIEFTYRLMLMHRAAILPDKRMYNRIFVCVWLFGFLILSIAYIGKKTD